MKQTLLLLVTAFLFQTAFAAPKVGDTAPSFELQNHEGKNFRLADREGKGWTVLFFYPKAGTPGCTKQACAFRDSIKAIRKHDAEVYGVSADTVADQAKFHKEHNLSFPLIADPKMQAINAYGAKMDGANLAKRWTFVIDPAMKIRWVDQNVDPVMDAKKVGAKLAELKAGSTKTP